MKAILPVFLATVRCSLRPLPTAYVSDRDFMVSATRETRERMDVCCD